MFPKPHSITPVDNVNVIKANQRTAMTLLELTIVLLIVGILAAVASPKFANMMRGTQAKSAAIQLAGYLRHVRRTAINESRVASMRFDRNLDTYSSDNVTFPMRLDVHLHVAIREAFDPSLELEFNFGGVTSDGVEEIQFDIEGAPYFDALPLQDGVITISSPGIASQHVVIANRTGYVNVLADAELNDSEDSADSENSDDTTTATDISNQPASAF